jgi:hypothetical protein
MIDLTGKKFGHLTVIELDKAKTAEIKTKGRWEKAWRCVCDCGKETSVIASKLKSGHTKSCGHISGENTRNEAAEKAGKNNAVIKNYDNYAEISLNGIKTLIDKQFIGEVVKYNWLVSKAGYLFRHVNKGETVWLHRFVMGMPSKEKTVDHINHNKLDNRCENLRVCTETENNRNTVLRKDNATGYKGVHFFNGKYRAKIHVYGKTIQIGIFDTAEKAHEAYVEAARHYFGEFACAS